MKLRIPYLLPITLLLCSCLGGSRIVSGFDTVDFNNNSKDSGFVFSDSLEGKVSFYSEDGIWKIENANNGKSVRYIGITETSTQEQVLYTCIKTSILWNEKKQIREYHKMEKLNQKDYGSRYKLLGFDFLNFSKHNYCYSVTTDEIKSYRIEYYSNQNYVIISYNTLNNSTSDERFKMFSSTIKSLKK